MLTSKKHDEIVNKLKHDHEQDIIKIEKAFDYITNITAKNLKKYVILRFVNELVLDYVNRDNPNYHSRYIHSRERTMNDIEILRETLKIIDSNQNSFEQEKTPNSPNEST